VLQLLQQRQSLAAGQLTARTCSLGLPATCFAWAGRRTSHKLSRASEVFLWLRLDHLMQRHTCTFMAWRVHGADFARVMTDLLLCHAVSCCAVLCWPLQDEVITPPIPHSWSMWYMGYGPGNKLQHTLDVVSYNVSYLLQTAEPGQLCPIAAWGAYWTMRTHAIPVDRCVRVSKWG
jgi:hypothetical protein